MTKKVVGVWIFRAAAPSLEHATGQGALAL
jgi:hypothetical protein